MMILIGNIIRKLIWNYIIVVVIIQIYSNTKSNIRLIIFEDFWESNNTIIDDSIVLFEFD